MVEFLILQAELIFINLFNVYIDAYKILKHKTIAHWLNLCAYLFFAVLFYVLVSKPELKFCCFSYLDFLLFLFSAFFNRQIFFDIPLNLKRGLSSFYVSLDKPPKAWLDRQEVKFFGYNGKKITIFYATLFFICFIIKLF